MSTFFAARVAVYVCVCVFMCVCLCVSRGLYKGLKFGQEGREGKRRNGASFGQKDGKAEKGQMKHRWAKQLGV